MYPSHVGAILFKQKLISSEQNVTRVSVATHLGRKIPGLRVQDPIPCVYGRELEIQEY